MKKDIKDYLHLYLQSRISVFIFDEKSITNGFLERYKEKYPDGEYAPVLTFLNYPRFLNDGYKPILRPLSDMTEEERKELWRLIFSQGHGKNFSERAKDFTGQVRFIDEKTYYDVPRHVMMQGIERLGIESDGTIWADCDLHNWRHNQHETTRWLLSKGFDLFGLIEAGLAIDKTTLKQEA